MAGNGGEGKSAAGQRMKSHPRPDPVPITHRRVFAFLGTGKA